MKRSILAAACGLMLLSSGGPAQAQAPVPGQPYQIPAGYDGYPAGTSIAYGGYNYVIQANATMLLADQPAGAAVSGDADGDVDADDQEAAQAYQIPDGYAAYPAGTTITYGGGSYVIQPNGTMLLASQSSGAAVGSDAGAEQTYLVPQGYTTYPVGSQITYGGLDYTIGQSGTMVLVFKGPSKGGPWHGKPHGPGWTSDSHYGPGGHGTHTPGGPHPGATHPGGQHPHPGTIPHPGGQHPHPGATHPGGPGYRPPGTMTHPGGPGYRQPTHGGFVGGNPHPGPVHHQPARGGFAPNGPRPGGGSRPPMSVGRRGH